jgi:hypothetical protein
MSKSSKSNVKPASPLAGMRISPQPSSAQLSALDNRRPVTASALKAFLLSPGWGANEICFASVSFIEAFCRKDLTVDEIRVVDQVVSYFNHHANGKEKLQLEADAARTVQRYYPEPFSNTTAGLTNSSVSCKGGG